MRSPVSAAMAQINAQKSTATSISDESSSPIDRRIARLKSTGHTFVRLVGIQLSSIPDGQTFLDAVKHEYSDINFVPDDQVNDGAQLATVWPYTIDSATKSGATVHAFVKKCTYPLGSQLTVKGNSETGQFRVTFPRIQGGRRYLVNLGS